MNVTLEKRVDGEWYEYGTYDLLKDWDLEAFMRACKMHKDIETRAVRTEGGKE